MKAEEFKKFRKDCDEKILAIHGVDTSNLPIDEDRLQQAMEDGINPIDIAIQFDPDNFIEEE